MCLSGCWFILFVALLSFAALVHGPELGKYDKGLGMGEMSRKTVHLKMFTWKVKQVSTVLVK